MRSYNHKNWVGLPCSYKEWEISSHLPSGKFFHIHNDTDGTHLVMVEIHTDRGKETDTLQLLPGESRAYENVLGSVQILVGSLSRQKRCFVHQNGTYFLSRILSGICHPVDMRRRLKRPEPQHSYGFGIF